MPLTLRRPTTSQQWSTRLLDGLLFLAAATALIWSLPIRTPWIGLDPGWVESLVQATDAGRIYGSDVVFTFCLLYTSPSPRDGLLSRMPSSA